MGAGRFVIPFPSKLFVLIPAQIPQSQPVLLKFKSHSHFLFFLFHESQSQCIKSHFPASKKGKSQLPLYPSRPSRKTGRRVYNILSQVTENNPLLSVPRDPPKIITIRNYRKFDEREFQTDINRAPFQVFEVFEDPADAYHAWNLVFTEICDKHASLKEIKISIDGLPWVTKEIRMIMKQRCKALKKARKVNDPRLKWNMRMKLQESQKQSINNDEKVINWILLQPIRRSANRRRLLESTKKGTRNYKIS